MYQRLLLIFSVLCIAVSSGAQNVIDPNDGDYIYNSFAAAGSLTNPRPRGADTMQKWVHDPTQKNRIGGFQTSFKSYRWNNISFRLRFPNPYDPTKKYPCVIFLHGAGEAADYTNSHNTITTDRENQDQLFWGADTFAVRVDRKEWNGFLLFPQLLTDQNGAGSQWDNNTFPTVNGILDTLTKYNGLDPDRVIVMGLSAGGVGAVTYASDHPLRIASVIASSPREIEGLVVGKTPHTENFVQIPIWMASGGIDFPPSGPDPATALKSRDSMAVHGADIYYSYYPTLAHDTWEQQWSQVDIFNRFILSSYWNSAHKAQPLVYFQNNAYCAGTPISTKLGLSAGFSAYEWQFDNGSGFTTVSTASNTYIATQAGKYRVRFKRTPTSDWSAWTPNPVVISTKHCSVDTVFAEHFETTPTNPYVTEAVGGGNSAFFYQNTTCQNGIFPNNTEVFSQDATGRQGGRFMLNATAVSSCTYKAGDQVWRSYFPANVAPNTTYLLSFYMGNYATTFTNAGSPNAALTATINNVSLSPAKVEAVGLGNISWKKYSYIWNSGNTTFAQLAILDNTTDANGNDFVIDEISLVKYKKPVSPGGAFTTLSLWSRADDLMGADSTIVGVWANDNLNGNYLQQPDLLQGNNPPLLRTNAPGSINFNPAVSFDVLNRRFLKLAGGISGNGVTHNAASAYIVANLKDLAQQSMLLTESQGASSGLQINAETSGSMSWYAGTGGASAIGTAAGLVELNKPALWTFSKNNNGTGISAGNTQDIRKNGVVVKSGTSTSTFTGDGSPFFAGTNNTAGSNLNGSIAEIVYVLDSNITALTQNRIESYLALKYGTTLGSMSAPLNYTASDSTTVFWTANTKYQNDVFGIGTDSASGLVQKQSNSVNSGSGDGTGQSAKGNLVLSTSTELLNKRFLMIGNDAGSLAQQLISGPVVNPIALGSTRVGRNWKAYNTGSVGAVSISFDTTGLGMQTGVTVNSYALMISNTGDDTYHSPLSFSTATGISGKRIMFSGVMLANGAVFTVITNNLNLALPAVWLGFTAVAVNGNAVLNWKTADEINVDRYTIEHSFNGVSFSAVGSVAANNSTGENNYSYTDNGLAPGIHYYRIRRTDKDGKSEYSDIKSLKITSSGANVQVRPNPVTGSTLVLAVSVQQSSKTNVQVMGADGKVIVHQNINLATGNNLVNVNISAVPPGIYLVQVQLNNEVVTKKFIKER